MPPEAYFGQTLSATWLNTYYGGNAAALIDMARAQAAPWRVGRITNSNSPGAPDSGGQFLAKLRHRFNRLYWRVTVFYPGYPTRPIIKIKTGDHVLADVAAVLNTGGSWTQTVSGTEDITETHGLVIGEGYTLALWVNRATNWHVDAWVELETWYEVDPSAPAYTAPSIPSPGSVLTAAYVNSVRTAMNTLALFATRANWAFSDVKEGWDKTGDLTVNAADWNSTRWRMGVRLRYLRFHVTWVYWSGDPTHQAQILINGVVVKDLATILPPPPHAGEITEELDGDISLSGYSGVVSVEFRHKPGNADQVYGGSIALTQMYQTDGDDDPVPTGWVPPTTYDHLDYPASEDWAAIVTDLELIHALAASRVNQPSPIHRHWVEVGNDNTPASNGLVIVHRAPILYYQQTSYDSADGPAIYPLGGEDTSVALPTDKDRGKLLSVDLSRVDWLKAGGVVYRVTNAAFAWEDEGWTE